MGGRSAVVAAAAQRACTIAWVRDGNSKRSLHILKALGPCADAKAGSRPATALRPPGSSHGKGVLPAPASASEEQGCEIVAHRGSLTGGPGALVPVAGTDLAGAGPAAGVKPNEPSFTTEDSSAADGSDAASMVGWGWGWGERAPAWGAAGWYSTAQPRGVSGCLAFCRVTLAASTWLQRKL